MKASNVKLVLQPPNKPASVSILSFNLLGIPLLTKNYSSRMKKLVEEIIRLDPDILCFQEAWLASTRRLFCQKLAGLGFQYFFHPREKLQFNGLLVLSKYPIIKKDAWSLGFRFKGFNFSLLELLMDKGFAMVKIKLAKQKPIFVFNVHFSVDWTKAGLAISKTYQDKLKEIKVLSDKINGLGKQPVAAAGDFNFEKDSLFYRQLLKNTGLFNPLADSVLKTILFNLYYFPLAKHGKKRDFIFVKNFPKTTALAYQILWAKPFPGLGRLSDHAGILIKLKI